MPESPPPGDLTLGEVWRGYARLERAIRDGQDVTNNRFDALATQIASAGFVSRNEYEAHRTEQERRMASLEESRSWSTRFAAGAIVLAILCPLIVAFVLGGAR